LPVVAEPLALQVLQAQEPQPVVAELLLYYLKYRAS
jgi:hypothetical protein